MRRKSHVRFGGRAGRNGAVTATLLSLVALTFAVDIAGSVIRRSLR